MARKTFRKIITSPELSEKINPKNIELMEQFLREKAISRSEKTIVVYRSNLNIFFTWNLLHNNNKFFIDIKKMELSAFIAYIVDEMKVGSAKINAMRSVLSSLSNFIEKFYDEDYPAFRNVVLRVIENAPKEERREKTILTDEQVEELLEHLKSTNKQQACWLALAICSGARFSELLSFETDLIDINRTAFGDIFLETTRKIKTKGRGKSGKMIYKYIIREKFLPYYLEWIKEREEIIEKTGNSHLSLFIKTDGTPATPAIIRGWIKEFENYLEVPLYPHALRHYLTTLLAKKNIPHHLIKEIFGWSDLAMVDLYNDMSAKDRSYEELENIKF